MIWFQNGTVDFSTMSFDIDLKSKSTLEKNQFEAEQAIILTKTVS